MGACKIDIFAKQRAIDEKYRMETEDGVSQALSDVSRLAGTSMRGNYAAVDLIVDLESAITEAAFTPEEIRQIERHVAGGESAGPDVIARIAAVFQRWEYDRIEEAAA